MFKLVFFCPGNRDHGPINHTKYCWSNGHLEDSTSTIVQISEILNELITIQWNVSGDLYIRITINCCKNGSFRLICRGILSALTLLNVIFCDLFCPA